MLNHGLNHGFFLSLFKLIAYPISQGVLQVHVDAYNRLFSCGADGSMKVRQLPDRDFIVSAI